MEARVNLLQHPMNQTGKPPLENELGLPEPLVRSIQNDTYVRGEADYTVTQLINPPRIEALKAKFGDKITEDVADRIFSLFGRAIHTILEQAADERYQVETRYQTEFEGATISGQIDLYDKQEKSLEDWKITSRWVAVEGPKDEWVAQQNINRYIMWRNKIEVKRCRNILIYRDWSKLQAAMKQDYPQRQVEIVPIPLWSKEEVETYLSERIAMHRAARSVELPLCTDKERWAKPTRYALMQKGRKTAIKLYDIEDQAKGAVDGSKGRFVEERPGTNQRCRFYCPVLPFCSQGRELVQDEVGE